eukprot:scaffold277203_cov42-Prasinocladus_malaysianus.AAC.1
METADEQAEEMVGPHYTVVDRQWLAAHADILAEGSQPGCEVLAKSWRCPLLPNPPICCNAMSMLICIRVREHALEIAASFVPLTLAI